MTSQSNFRPLLRILRFVTVVYLGVVLGMAFLQRSFIYYPQPADEAASLQRAERKGWQPWLDADKNRIGWQVTLSDAPTSLVIFHGNAGSALMRDYWVAAWSRVPGGSFGSIYIFEYPGYGGRPGRPSEANFQKAALAAVQPLLPASVKEAGTKETEHALFLLGESIGSGVATWVAARFPDEIAGLVLVTPFTRLSDVGSAHFPFLPVRWLLRDQYNCQKHLRGYPGPVAFVIAADDTVVPTPIQQELFKSYTGTARRWVIEEAGHNSLFERDGSATWREITRFLID